jgi:4-hydroxybenzoate polyprenyltransferase
MLRRLRLLLEMIRFSHTVFALPFALTSAALAWYDRGRFSWLDLAGILLCMVFARSVAMAFNRIVDRHIDAANPRTANRHLPAGSVSLTTACAFLLACAVGFVGSTALFLLAEPSNPWPLIFAVPVLLFICAYSYTKRFTILAHFWLGASLMLAPVAAWVSIRGMENLTTPLILGLAVLFWVAGFDILYACQDTEFDRRAQLRSVPALLGVPVSLRVALVCHVGMLALLLLLYFLASPPLGYVYLTGVLLVAVLLVYEHSLVRPDDLSRVNQAFFQVNALVSIGLLVVVLIQLVVGV